jgi:hypothetical protein
MWADDQLDAIRGRRVKWEVSHYVTSGEVLRRWSHCDHRWSTSPPLPLRLTCYWYHEGHGRAFSSENFNWEASRETSYRGTTREMNRSNELGSKQRNKLKRAYVCVHEGDGGGARGWDRAGIGGRRRDWATQPLSRYFNAGHTVTILVLLFFSPSDLF